MTAADPPSWNRLIVELGAGADPAALRAAAGFARLLGLDLHCVFVEDEAVLTLAELPFAREIRLPTHEWTPLASDRLAEELRHAAEQARRGMQETAAALGISNVFEVLRGDPAACIAGLCSTTDIVVVTQPAAAGARFGGDRLPDAVHGMAAAVLLLPGGLEERSGPVVAVLRDAADPALEVAARIAVEADSALLILLPGGPQAPISAAIDRARALALSGARIAGQALANDDADSVVDALGGVLEQLIVIGRADSGAGSPAGAMQLATVRGVPVLIAEPPR